MSFIKNLFKGPPKPPDPYETAAAQAGMNKEAIREAALHNQINQVGPLGSSTWSGEIGSPDRTQTTTLSPEQQALLQQGQGIQGGVGGLIESLLPQVGQALTPGAWEGHGLQGPGTQTGIAPDMAPLGAVAPGNIQDMVAANQPPEAMAMEGEVMPAEQPMAEGQSPLVQQLSQQYPQMTPEQMEALANSPWLQGKLGSLRF